MSEKIGNRKLSFSSTSKSLTSPNHNANISSPETSPKKTFFSTRTSISSLSRTNRRVKSKDTANYKKLSWNDEHKYYSTSEESELEEVFVPRKIWIKPSARPLSPTLFKPDATPRENSSVNCINSSRFNIRQPVILVRKIDPDSNVNQDFGGSEVSCISDPRGKSFTNCCLRWHTPIQRSVCDTQSISVSNEPALETVEPEEHSESKEFAHEELRQCSTTVEEASEEKPETKELTGKDLPPGPEIAGDIPEEILESSEYSGKELPPCSTPVDKGFEEAAVPTSNHAAVPSDLADQESVTLLEKPPDSCTPKHFSSGCSQLPITRSPESNSITVPTHEPVEGSSRNSSTPLGIATEGERNPIDTSIFSPVIFDEEPPTTTDFSSEVMSPIIFGSNEGAAIENCDTTNQAKDHSLETTNNTCNSSSGFVLELSAEECSETEATGQNCLEIASDASRNFTLQLSENASNPNSQSGTNSQEFNSSSNFNLQIPSQQLVDDTSVCANSHQSSSRENIPPSDIELNNLCVVEAPCLSISEKPTAVLEKPKLSRNETSDSPAAVTPPNLLNTKKVYLSVTKDPNYSKKVWLSAVKPPNLPKGQKILCSVKSTYPAESQNLSAIKAPNHERNKNEDQLSENKEFSTSTGKVPNYSEIRKSCLSATQVANLPESCKSYLHLQDTSNSLVNQKSYLFPIEATDSPCRKVVNSPNSMKHSDAFTQTDPQKVCHQPPQLSVNCIINSSGVDSIRFESRVTNHQSTITASAEIDVPKSDSQREKDIVVPKSDGKRDQDSSISLGDITKPLSNSCSDSALAGKMTTDQPLLDDRQSATKSVVSFIDLTNDEDHETKPTELNMGKIRLKTPSELGCTIAFTDDVERLFQHELPPLHCDLEKLDLLKKKHFNIFRVVVAKYFLGTTVSDSLVELYQTRSVPSGSNLLRDSPLQTSASVQMAAELLSAQSSICSKLFYGKGISNCTHNSVLLREHPK